MFEKLQYVFIFLRVVKYFSAFQRSCCFMCAMFCFEVMSSGGTRNLAATNIPIRKLVRDPKKTSPLVETLAPATLLVPQMLITLSFHLPVNLSCLDVLLWPLKKKKKKMCFMRHCSI